MVASLWKSVNELESYAKEAEYGCLKLKQVLESMAFSYEEDLPQVPDSSSLEAYPLDYEDPECKLLHYMYEVNIICDYSLMTFQQTTLKSIVAAMGRESWRSSKLNCCTVSYTCRSEVSCKRRY